MPAYIIFTKEKTTNQAELDIYSGQVPKTMEGVNLKVLVGYGAQKVVEGPQTEGVVVLEFPSFKEAEDYYYSPRYQEIIQHRFNGAIYSAVIVEGYKRV
jgi:uncharacterized protein (DUF1330 family)